MVKVVIGANFGDEGKGLMTDYFSSQMGGNGVVVLSNGGPQRGHTVVHNGKRHVFHHFGSGTLNDYETYCPSTFIVNPILYCKEKYELLYKFDILANVIMHPDCMITTPWDMMANQIIESARDQRHGSCGMGIWETIKRDAVIPLRYRDHIYEGFVNEIRDYYKSRFIEHGIDSSDYDRMFFEDDDLVCCFVQDFECMFQNVIICKEDVLNDFDNIIFENGQGLLLDKDNHEYQPNTTPSYTGMRNPWVIMERLEQNTTSDVEVCYVTRSYLTRHGAGKMPDERDRKEISELIALDATNVPNEWQGELRYGIIDSYDLISRTKDDFYKYAPRDAKMTVAITHLNEYCPDWTNKIGDYYSFSETEIKKGN